MRALIAVLCVALAAPVAAQPAPQAGAREVARQHFRNGDARFRAGDYRGALVEFLAAHAIAPSPILVHNVAVCHERLGEVGEAARRYRDYLQLRPDAPNRREIEIRIAALEGAQRPPEVLPPEEPPDGDALSEPRSLAEPPPAAPPARPYDEPFARRVPQRAPYAAGQPQQPPPEQAQQPPPYGQPPPYPQPQAAPPYPEPPPAATPPVVAKKSTPLYKQWWFWVFVGVGTLILIDVAADSDDDGAAAAKGLEFRF